MIRTALRGARDGFCHDLHEHTPTYETGARIGDAVGRVLDHILLSPRGSAMPGEDSR